MRQPSFHRVGLIALLVVLAATSGAAVFADADGLGVVDDIIFVTSVATLVILLLVGVSEHIRSLYEDWVHDESGE